MPTYTPRALLVPYLAPYLLYVAIASLPGDVLGREASYALRGVLVACVLAWFWSRTLSLRGPGSPWISVAIGGVAGLVGTALWVALLEPLAGEGGEPWSPAAFALRLAVAGTLVPLLEEGLMRGYVLRLALLWDRARRVGVPKPFDTVFATGPLDRVEPGAWSPVAVMASTLVFTAGHGLAEWPAAVAYGLLMALLWIARGDLLSCVVAHGVTNVTLALYVRSTGQWALW